MDYHQPTIDACNEIVERAIAFWHATGKQAETTFLMSLSAEIRGLTDPRAGTYMPFPEPAEPSICDDLENFV